MSLLLKPCVVGDGVWERHFTDMEYGLPESDILSGNLAYVDYNQMQALKKYLPEQEPSLEEKILEAEIVKDVQEQREIKNQALEPGR